MKLILPSFGLSHITRKNKEIKDFFYRMPPVSLSQIYQKFTPDYSALLLAEKLIIDKQTYETLTSGYHRTFSDVSNIIRALNDEGFLQIEDFEKVIQNNEALLKQMLKRDLRDLDLWIKPLNESVNNWRNFTELFSDNLRKEIYNDPHHYDIGVSEKLYEDENDILAVKLGSSYFDKTMYLQYLEDALNSSVKRRKSLYRYILKKHLSKYLSYVNANLLLSQKFESGFHDWQDFQPFYKEKYLRIAMDSTPAEKAIQNVKKLFEISFPDFSNWNHKNLIRALKDYRITDLRELIDSASNDDIVFDEKFANRVLSEVLKIESNIGKIRKIVSYTTIPLGYIPIVGNPIQKIAEEGIMQPIQKKSRQKYRWFYMISELANK